jgi:uncharacterized protein YqjF (DUF2071 family)
VSRPFLTAAWRNLFLANYAVPPSLAQSRLPPGVSLDRYRGDAYVSLVAFQFLKTRVFGVRWPGYRDFPELNLRFYARVGKDRGVVFEREFVPHRLTAWIARSMYNEPYLAAPMSVKIEERANEVTAEYRLYYAGRGHTIAVTGNLPAFTPPEGTVEHFFKEENWGFGTTRRGDSLRYAVEHPVWSVYAVRRYAIDLDFAAVYGPEWGFLQQEEPRSTVFAVGSSISVSPRATVPLRSLSNGNPRADA